MIHCVPPEEPNVTIGIRVLSCDTISQSKQKCIDVIYRNFPLRDRPTVADVDMGKSQI